MRYALIAIVLFALGACTPGPLPPAQVSNPNNLLKYVQPTNGAAYSQSDLYYYTTGVNPGAMGPSGVPRGK
jgi:hypothetical protein